MKHFNLVGAKSQGTSNSSSSGGVSGSTTIINNITNVTNVNGVEKSTENYKGKITAANLLALDTSLVGENDLYLVYASYSDTTGWSKGGYFTLNGSFSSFISAGGGIDTIYRQVRTDAQYKIQVSGLSAATTIGIYPSDSQGTPTGADYFAQSVNNGTYTFTPTTDSEYISVVASTAIHILFSEPVPDGTFVQWCETADLDANGVLTPVTRWLPVADAGAGLSSPALFNPLQSTFNVITSVSPGVVSSNLYGGSRAGLKIGEFSTYTLNSENVYDLQFIENPAPYAGSVDTRSIVVPYSRYYSEGGTMHYTDGILQHSDYARFYERTNELTAQAVQTGTDTDPKAVSASTLKGLLDAKGSGTITEVKRNGVSVATSGVADISVPTKTSQLTNDSGFATMTWVNGRGFLTSQEQANWSTTDTTAASFIKNKPVAFPIQSEPTDLDYSVANLAQYITTNALAYWNGRYDDGQSNLMYCDKGRFGDIITHSASEYVTLTTEQTITGKKVFSSSDTALFISRSGQYSLNAFIGYRNNTTDIGYIGVVGTTTTNGKPAFIPGTASGANALVRATWETAVGDANTPVYIDANGVAQSTGKSFSSYALASSVPTKTSQLTNDSGFVTANTTYSFAGGTDGFSVTPSGGSANAVSVLSSRIERSGLKVINTATTGWVPICNLTFSGVTNYDDAFVAVKILRYRLAQNQKGEATTIYAQVRLNDGAWNLYNCFADEVWHNGYFKYGYVQNGNNLIIYGYINNDNYVRFSWFVDGYDSRCTFSANNSSILTSGVTEITSNVATLRSSVQPLDYSGYNVHRVPTINTLAYWNGQYSTGYSNLQYCDRGRFGDVITHSDSEYLHGTVWLGITGGSDRPGNMYYTVATFTHTPVQYKEWLFDLTISGWHNSMGGEATIRVKGTDYDAANVATPNVFYISRHTSNENYYLPKVRIYRLSATQLAVAVYKPNTWANVQLILTNAYGTSITAVQNGTSYAVSATYAAAADAPAIATENYVQSQGFINKMVVSSDTTLSTPPDKLIVQANSNPTKVYLPTPSASIAGATIETTIVPANANCKAEFYNSPYTLYSSSVGRVETLKIVCTGTEWIVLDVNSTNIFPTN